MREMSKEEIRSFLMDTVRTGKLASVRSDGRPHVTPIWYVLDGDDLIFTTYYDTIKLKNIRRSGEVMLCVDMETPPFAYVLIEGKATVESGTPADLLPWATKIGARYMGEDQGEAFGKRNAVEGEFLIRVKPTKIIARTEISS